MGTCLKMPLLKQKKCESLIFRRIFNGTYFKDGKWLYLAEVLALVVEVLHFLFSLPQFSLWWL
jgi:hypothetical protein